MAKKQKCPECEACEKWAVPTADFFSLLLALFIALYAIAAVNTDKAKIVTQSFVEIFKAQPPAPDATVLPIPPPPGKSNSDTEAVKAGSPQQMDEMSDMLKQLKQLSDKEGTGSQTEIVTTESGVKIRGFDGVVFEKGSVQLSLPFQRMLSLIASVIRETPNEIKIEGFTTPNDAWGSAYPTNWELSASRASMVARYLINRERVDPKRIVVVGHAHNKPYDDANPENFMNRRVEITIMHYGGAQGGAETSILDEPKEKVE